VALIATPDNFLMKVLLKKKEGKKIMFAEQVIHAAIFFCACLICVPSLRDPDGPLLILITLTWSHDLASSSL
jgi:hypothetical protein